jgi:1-acyl-sn-glycerol-3-phosphate acyltransferase
MTWLRTIRDWVFSVPTVVLFGLTLGFYEIAGRVALLFGRRPFEWTMAALQRTLLWVFRVSNVKVEVEMGEGFDPAKGYVMLSNHQSMFDVPIFGGLLVRAFPKYVAKAELGRWIPAVSLNLQHGGNALIRRNDRTGALRAIRKLGRECQERGTSVVIFPEGTRARTGELQPFKPAGATTLLRGASDMAVVPTAIDGSWKVFRKNMFPIPFGTKVRVYFGSPIERSDGADAATLVAEAERVVAAVLDRWRAAPASA